MGTLTAIHWDKKMNNKYVLVSDGPKSIRVATYIFSLHNYNVFLSCLLQIKCFLDMKPGGAMCQILATMFRYKAEQRWRKFDFQVGKVCIPSVRVASSSLPSHQPQPSAPAASAVLANMGYGRFSMQLHY